jgi:glycosyltransferase involved in cell wall biosynthesis
VRVLVLHSRYLSGAASGENRVVEDETRLLREAGHDVTLWDPAPEGLRGGRLLRAGIESIWSTSAGRHVRDLIQLNKIEVLHCHNLFPLLSPAVLRPSASDGVSVVMTLHNYRLLCLPATFVRDGRICEDCLGRLPWPGVVHACYRGSHPASAALAASVSAHRAYGTFGRVDLYLAVSPFVREKYLQAGWSPAQIVVKPNFVWPLERRNESGDYFLFLGRLAREKGLRTLLDAWRNVSARLLVAGDGPEGSDLRSMAPPGVEFVGAVPSSAVPPLLQRARAVLVPSLWYEGQPRTILEAYAAGVPVIASDIGGLPEVVEEGVSGVLVAPGDAGAWTKALHRLLDDSEARRLGQGAHAAWRALYTPERGLANLEQAYREARGKGTPRHR